VSWLPFMRRTWAAVGQPLVLVHRVELAAGLNGRSPVVRVGGGGCSVCFPCPLRQLGHRELIEVIGQLRRFRAGEKATLLWDGLPAHRSKAMAALLATWRDWLVVERLLGYAPDLNRVEQVWSSLKGNGLANVGAEGLGEVIAAAWHGIERIRQPGSCPAGSCAMGWSVS
jgi:DDE superfamily endonuclease